MEDPSPEVLGDLPPSCVLVYKVLSENGPMTATDLQETAYLADRTARRALGRLEDCNLVTSRPGLAGKKLFEIDG